MGRLLVIYEEGPPGRHYVSASSKRTTSNIDEALIVTFIPSSEPHSIGCIVRNTLKFGFLAGMTGDLNSTIELYGTETWRSIILAQSFPVSDVA